MCKHLKPNNKKKCFGNVCMYLIDVITFQCFAKFVS